MNYEIYGFIILKFSSKDVMRIMLNYASLCSAVESLSSAPSSPVHIMMGEVHEIAPSKVTISWKWHPKNREEKQEHSANFRSRNYAIGSHRPILFLGIGKQVYIAQKPGCPTGAVLWKFLWTSRLRLNQGWISSQQAGFYLEAIGSFPIGYRSQFRWPLMISHIPLDYQYGETLGPVWRTSITFKMEERLDARTR